MFERVWNAGGMIFMFDLSQLNDGERIEAIAAVSQTIAALLSLMALMLSLWVFSRQQRLNRWQLRLAREDHIIAWARMCLSAMAEVEEHIKCHELTGEAFLTRGEIVGFRARISALIDEGRLYFPNIKDPKKGAEKDIAFRGHRQKVLDELVAFYDGLARIQEQSSGSNNARVIEELNKLRRSFVSETQATIDPRLFNRISA